MKKNPAAVALGKLAASKRTREQLAASGRQGGLTKAARLKARQNGTAPASVPSEPSVWVRARKSVPSKKKKIAFLEGK